MAENILIDTNVFINLGKGSTLIDTHLEGKQLFYSHITEIEILGYHAITQSDIDFFESIFFSCIAVELSAPIRLVAIDIRHRYKLKTQDAIIAATALHLGIPIITFDGDFKKITELIVIDLRKNNP